MRVVELLKSQQVDVVTYDPLLTEYAGMTLIDAARDADYLAVLVSHSAILEVVSEQSVALLQAMRSPRIHVF
jgi:hypothetical protein